MVPNLRHPKLRKFHRQVAPVVFIPLLLTTLTGIAYRLGRSWLGIPEDIAETFMAIHQGEFLGQPLVPFYVLLSGLGLLGMIATGLTMVRWQRLGTVRSLRLWPWVHHLVAVLAFLPLTISALTGMGYRIGRAWFDLPGNWAGRLLRLHQGAYLGPSGQAFYVLVIGLGLLGLLMTGIHLSGLFHRRRSSASGEP